MIVVDTSVWIDYFAERDTPQVAYLDDRLEEGDDEVCLTDIVLTEIWQGLGTEKEARQVDARLSVLDVLMLNGLPDFWRAAALYRAARRRGITIRRTSDCLIASVCVRDRIPLLHADADFDRLAKVTDLEVVVLPNERESDA